MRRLALALCALIAGGAAAAFAAVRAGRRTKGVGGGLGSYLARAR